MCTLGLSLSTIMTWRGKHRFNKSHYCLYFSLVTMPILSVAADWPCAAQEGLPAFKRLGMLGHSAGSFPQSCLCAARGGL